MKFCIAIILLFFVVLITACGPHKPSYENVKVETQSEQAAAKTAQADQQNQGQGTTGKAEDNPAAKVAQEVQQSQQTQQNQQDASSQRPKFQMPAFFDTQKSQIKDLPTFPKAKIINMQASAANDMPTVILMYQLRAPIEEAVAFYEKQIKANGWMVVTSSKTPGYNEWTLKKGERDQAIVNIKKDQQYMLLSINRNQLPEAAK